MRELFAKLFFSLPNRILVRLSGQPPMTADGGRVFDGANQLLLLTLLKKGFLGLDLAKSAEEHRKTWGEEIKEFEKPSLSGVVCRDLSIPSKNHQIRIREYQTKSIEANSPALLYIHGGGFTVFDIETYQSFCEFVSKTLNIKVYSVDYRLAPEHPFPTPLDDCCSAYEWLVKNADSLGIDSNRVAVGGDSAGGNLTAALCLKNKIEKKITPKAQLLIYPSTDLRAPFDKNSQYSSINEFSEGQIITREHLKWFHSNYVPDVMEMNNPLVSPLLAKDLSGLPPAVIITAGFDPLRDEAQEYAKKLEKSDVHVQHKEYSNLGHGFIVADVTKQVRIANREICEMLDKVL